MRAVSLFIATSLDGYIARSDHGIDWLFDDDDYGYGAFYAAVDTILMGRRTYEQALAFPQWPYPGKRTYVFSRTRREPAPYVTFVDIDPASFVRDLRAGTGGTIWLVGGGEIVAALLPAGLVQEIVLSIHPVLLGKGVPLFLPSPTETPLTLERTESFPSGLVQLTYTVTEARS